MRLDEIDRWHPGMLDALSKSHADRDSVTELLRVLIGRVDLLWRQQVVHAGGEDPGPIEVPRPGAPVKKKGTGLGGLARALMGQQGR